MSLLWTRLLPRLCKGSEAVIGPGVPRPDRTLEPSKGLLTCISGCTFVRPTEPRGRHVYSLPSRLQRAARTWRAAPVNLMAMHLGTLLNIQALMQEGWAEPAETALLILTLCSRSPPSTTFGLANSAEVLVLVHRKRT